jgi:hypothetical protein
VVSHHVFLDCNLPAYGILFEPGDYTEIR